MESNLPNCAAVAPQRSPLQLDHSAEPHWYAAYTFSRHEKTVQEQLALRSVDTYLPLFEKRSRWKDRIVRLQVPLFPGYVFVRIPLALRFCVLDVPGVVRLVAFNGRAVALPDKEIEALRRSLAIRRAEPFPYLKVGKRVRVQAGPLEGLEGVIVRRKGQVRIVVSINSMERSIAVELEASDVDVLAA